MKLKLMLLCASAILFLTACGKDKENCPSDDLGSVIVGLWDVNALGQAVGQVEFKADGTLIDQNDVLIGGEVNGTTLDEKTYTVPSNQTLKAKAAKGSQFTEVEFDVSNFSCDEVQLTVLGLSATLTRR